MVKFASVCLSIFTLSNARARELQSDEESEFPTIDEVLDADDDLSTLALALNTSGLAGALPTDAFTSLFAPVNAAFDAVDDALLTKLLMPKWILHLQNLLLFHAASSTDERILANEFTDGTMLSMLNGENTTLSVESGGMDTLIFVNSNLSADAMVIDEIDIPASNGNVHKIDKVLLPSFAGTGILGLKDTPAGADFTILFEFFEQLTSSFGDTIDTLDFTVFAPNNAAFLALGNETLEELRQDSAKATMILSNHVLVGNVQPSVLLFPEGQDTPVSINSLGSLNLEFTQSSEGDFLINGIKISQADQLANNGIVHAIDGILMAEPDPSPTAAPVGAATPETAAPSSADNSTSDETSSTSGASRVTWVARSIAISFVGGVMAVIL